MTYILDSDGYIKSVSCYPISCDDKISQEYTGTIPDGYSSLDDWALNANIAAYEIVDNNLVYDEIKDAEIKRKEEITIPYNVYKDGEHIVGDWFGDELYRNIYRGKISSTDKEILESNIINNDLVLQNGTVHNQSGTQLGLGYNKEGYGSQVYINNGELTLSHTSDIIGDYHVILEYIKSKGYLVKGNSKQKTTSGKNLLNINGDLYSLKAYPTVIENNKVYVTTASNSGNTISSLLDYIPVEENESYIYTMKAVQGKVRYGLSLYDKDKKVIKNSAIVTGYTYLSAYEGYYSDTLKTFTIPSGYGIKYIRPIIFAMSNTSTPNVYEELMIRRASVTDDTYEPYTGGITSPNPNYPQSIEVVDNVKIKVGNKQTTIDLKGNCVSKIGDIQDYLLIHKKKYWLVKNVGRGVISLTSTYGTDTLMWYFFKKPTDSIDYGYYTTNGVSEVGLFDTTKPIYFGGHGNTSLYAIVYNKSKTGTIPTIEELKALVDGKYFYYQLAQPQLIELGELPEEVEVSDDVQLISNLDTRIVVTDNFNFNDYMN